MIKINLATKKRSQALTAGAGGGLLDKLKLSSGVAMPGINEQMKLSIGAMILCLVLGYAATSVWDSHKQEEIAAVQSQIEALESEIRKLDSEIAKTAGYEALDRDIKATEAAIRLKIQTIERLVAERRDPPLILKALSEIIPKDIWLTEFTLKSTDIRIQGSSRGLTAVSDFMKQLEETVYFREVTLKRTTSKRDQGVDIAQFEMEAKRK